MEALQSAQFSSASDVWSYGVTLWEIYSLARPPWEGLSPLDVRDSLMQGERLGQPERCPPPIFELMLACWKEKPEDRPTFDQIRTRLGNVRAATSTSYLLCPLSSPSPLTCSPLLPAAPHAGACRATQRCGGRR